LSAQLLWNATLNAIVRPSRKFIMWHAVLDMQGGLKIASFLLSVCFISRSPPAMHLCAGSGDMKPKFRFEPQFLSLVRQHSLADSPKLRCFTVLLPPTIHLKRSPSRPAEKHFSACVPTEQSTPYSILVKG
jgi:hypothetical protein